MANESSKDGKSAPNSASSNPSPSTSAVQEEPGGGKSENWALKSIGLIAYAVATAVGYFYASAYYRNFGINILDHAAPLDLLLVALENIDKVLLAAFVAPVVFLSSLAGLLIVLALFPIAGVYASMLAAWIVLMLCAAVLSAIAYPVAIAKAAALPFLWLQVAFQGLQDDKSARANAGRDDAQKAQGPLLAFWKAYKDAVNWKLPVWKPVDPQTYFRLARRLLDNPVSYVHEQGDGLLFRLRRWIKRTWKKVTAVYWFTSTDGQPKRGGRFKPWSDIDWLPRLCVLSLVLLFLLYLFSAASGFGIAKAEYVEQRARCHEGDDSLCESSDQFIRRARGFVPGLYWLNKLVGSVEQTSSRDGSDSSKETPPRVFAVPTGNLSSLEFSLCKGDAEEVDRRDLPFGQVNFRQDAGDEARHATPTCLAHLGATGSMHFFADFSRDGKGRKTKSGTSGQPTQPIVVILNGGGRVVRIVEPSPEIDLIRSCDLTALVGPFETRAWNRFDQNTKTRECDVVSKGKTVHMGFSNVSTAMEGVRKSTGQIVLVGRADIRPIHNEDTKSNLQLGQQRADWVLEESTDLENLINGVSILSVSGGPVDLSRESANSASGGPKKEKVGDDPCSRVVEVYQCPSSDRMASGEEASPAAKARTEHNQGQAQVDGQS